VSREHFTILARSLRIPADRGTGVHRLTPHPRDLRIALRSQLKLAGVEVSAGGVSGTLPRAREPFLLALRELRSDPGWVLKRTRALPLERKQRLVMIV